MFGVFEYLMGWLIVVCGKLYAYLYPPPKWLEQKGSLGYARYKGGIYPFCHTIGETIFLMDVVGKRGFNTIVAKLSEVEIIKYPEQP